MADGHYNQDVYYILNFIDWKRCLRILEPGGVDGRSGVARSPADRSANFS